MKKIFLIYSAKDQHKVSIVNKKLINLGIKTVMYPRNLGRAETTEDLEPAEALSKDIRSADHVIIFLSEHTTTFTRFHEEWEIANDASSLKPEGVKYLNYITLDGVVPRFIKDKIFKNSDNENNGLLALARRLRNAEIPSKSSEKGIHGLKFEIELPNSIPEEKLLKIVSGLSCQADALHRLGGGSGLKVDFIEVEVSNTSPLPI